MTSSCIVPLSELWNVFSWDISSMHDFIFHVAIATGQVIQISFSQHSCIRITKHQFDPRSYRPVNWYSHLPIRSRCRMGGLGHSISLDTLLSITDPRHNRLGYCEQIVLLRGICCSGLLDPCGFKKYGTEASLDKKDNGRCYRLEKLFGCYDRPTSSWWLQMSFLAPGHQQPPCWLDLAIRIISQNANMYVPCNS